MYCLKFAVLYCSCVFFFWGFIYKIFGPLTRNELHISNSYNLVLKIFLPSFYTSNSLIVILCKCSRRNGEIIVFCRICRKLKTQFLYNFQFFLVLQCKTCKEISVFYQMNKIAERKSGLETLQSMLNQGEESAAEIFFYNSEITNIKHGTNTILQTLACILSGNLKVYRILLVSFLQEFYLISYS